MLSGLTNKSARNSTVLLVICDFQAQNALRWVKLNQMCSDEEAENKRFLFPIPVKNLIFDK